MAPCNILTVAVSSDKKVLPFFKEGSAFGAEVMDVSTSLDTMSSPFFSGVLLLPVTSLSYALILF